MPIYRRISACVTCFHISGLFEDSPVIQMPEAMMLPAAASAQEPLNAAAAHYAATAKISLTIAR